MIPTHDARPNVLQPVIETDGMIQCLFDEN